VALTETAGYDYRMGTLTSTTDVNSNVITASYDVFGRLYTIAKPGDTAQAPTISTSYYNYNSSTGAPFQYIVAQRETAGGSVRDIQTFYDGLGRKIQTKAGSASLQNIVTDIVYDGVGQVVKTSQPRYVNESAGSFLSYTGIGPDSFENWTTTNYDGAGRVISTVNPDTTSTTNTYLLNGQLTDVSTRDANNHITDHATDVFGRLSKVVEWSGNGGSEGGYSVVGTSYYNYNQLDQLTNVADAQSKQTNMSYDSLGRKTSMTDPDMGSWSYTYDPNGNLTSELDGKLQQTNYSYDALDRLVNKSNYLFGDNFDIKDTTKWVWSSYQTAPYNDNGTNEVQSGSTNGANYNSQFYRNSYSLSSGSLVSARFKVDNLNSGASLDIENDDPTINRRIGVYAYNGVIQAQYTGDGTNWTFSNLITNAQINTWYDMQITLDDVGGYVVSVTQETNPAIHGSYTATVSPNHNWRFHAWNLNGNFYMTSYREFTNSYYNYDEAASSNGKGQRTSTADGNANIRYQYDARGRNTRTDYSLGGLSGVRTIQMGYDSGDRMTSLTYPNGETLTYSYDKAWRPTDMYSSVGNWHYVSGTQYTALGQMTQMQYANGLVQNACYNNSMARLTQISIGVNLTGWSCGTLGGFFNRTYSYDSTGNVKTIGDNAIGQTQNFGYDAQNRLTSAYTSGTTTNAYNQAVSYDNIGNITSKGGTTYTYDSSHAHRVSNVGSSAYSYDGNGNVLSGGGRNYSWSRDNMPTAIQNTSNGVSESYWYDADGQRVKKVNTAGGTGLVSYYIGGMWEEDSNGTTRALYQFGGKAMAQRTTLAGGSSSVVYLNYDHLGSASVASDGSGNVVSHQDFDPWGAARGGDAITSQTDVNYTGQIKDTGTGLLYYNSRFYDPALGRFLSADSIVPGAASGAGGGADTLGQDKNSELRPLTVDFHEAGFVATLGDENRFTQQKGFTFQLSDKDRQKAKNAMGPVNPQALNRYSYTLNNPVRYIDPTGHSVYMGQAETANYVTLLGMAASAFSALANDLWETGGVTTSNLEILSGILLKLGFAAVLVGATAIAGWILGIVALYGAIALTKMSDGFNAIAYQIGLHNGSDGVVIQASCQGIRFSCDVTIINRATNEAWSTINGTEGGLATLWGWKALFDADGNKYFEPGRACTSSGGNNIGSGNVYDDHFCQV
jgi:RHS repeat-associated protein